MTKEQQVALVKELRGLGYTALPSLQALTADRLQQAPFLLLEGHAHGLARELQAARTGEVWQDRGVHPVP
jgi:hypothetical protein